MPQIIPSDSVVRVVVSLWPHFGIKVLFSLISPRLSGIIRLGNVLKKKKSPKKGLLASLRRSVGSIFLGRQDRILARGIDVAGNQMHAGTVVWFQHEKTGLKEMK